MAKAKSLRAEHPKSRSKGTASVPAPGRTKPRPVGRERMNLMVDRAVLARAAAAAGTTNMSEVVNLALQRMAEDDAIIAGIDALLGAIPDFPYVES